MVEDNQKVDETTMTEGPTGPAILLGEWIYKDPSHIFGVKVSKSGLETIARKSLYALEIEMEQPATSISASVEWKGIEGQYSLDYVLKALNYLKALAGNDGWPNVRIAFGVLGPKPDAKHPGPIMSPILKMYLIDEEVESDTDGRRADGEPTFYLAGRSFEAESVTSQEGGASP